ncbi:MAG TPA: glycosyltransferase family 2 protein [Myxococcota bacterium]|nr:glycosyltransferase family 2 protein [Myxococcota bacterium]
MTLFAQPSITVVIVNWNGGDGVLACLESVRAQSRPANEIVVVDNASRDDSPECIEQRFPEVRMVRLGKNIGFGPAVNLGVEVTRAEWVALLNNDAIADREWLAELARAAVSAPDVGMVACKIYLDLQGLILDKVGHRISIDGQNFGRGHGCPDHGQYDGLAEVAWPDGCASLWRRDVFRGVGGLDEEFFAYADDADLGIRFRLAGWRCAAAPRAIVEHRHSQSLGAFSPKKLFLVERNRIWLAVKYFPWPLVLLNPFLWLYRAVLTLAAARNGEGSWSSVSPESRLAVARSILRAQVAGWAGVRRQIRKRARLGEACSQAWPSRLRVLLREAHVSIRDLARGQVE